MAPYGRRAFLGCGALGAFGLALGCSAEPPPHPQPVRRGIGEVGRRLAHEALPPYAPVRLREVRDRLAVVAERAPRPAPGDWLHDHPERGQSFEDYLGSYPTAPTPERRTIVVQPLGALSPSSRQIVELASTYLTCHFGLPSRVAEPADLGVVPRWARRVHQGSEQLLTRYLLDEVLPDRLPADAAALIGFLETDLWPGRGWNFVFGEATLERRLGVWSLARYGDPTKGPEAFRTTLRRALKLAVHETGHMFSLPHCTAYRCVQAGVNSLDEEDCAPMSLCPECLAKIAWVTSTDPRERLRAKRDFCRAHQLDDEARGFEALLTALESVG
jgi:archaemetzincin